PEAEPLPKKRGEIGFVEGVDEQIDDDSRPASRLNESLPARHPADIQLPPPAVTNTSGAASPTPTSNQGDNPVTPPSNGTAASSIRHKKGLLGFFKSDNAIAFGGFRATTLLIFVAQIIILGGTITTWVFAIRLMSSNSQNMSNGAASGIFIHVIFVIAVLAQLVFFERRIFRLRAERYSHLHPGEVLPRYRNGNGSLSGIPFAPWSRPPLPTYAAALAQSGIGTGDVEDNAIAVPPPPAYGNTRGSTLLLSGFLRDSLRAQRPISGHSQASETGDRPVSYASRDDQWEEIQAAERSQRLEETLSQ
ncbi:hypothetical protein BDQ17DRAFT_1178682, partial [Cyathus striatus]